MKSPEVAMLFFEELKFKHDQRIQAEQALKDVLTEHSAEHRANAEKRVMEFDTIIGQKWVDDLARESKRRRRETSPLEKYSNCDNVESLIEDDVGDENDYDKTDDEFDERFYPLFIINHTGRKCDGILFDNNSKIERLVFENVCSPGKTKPPKYHRDHFVTRLILFVRDSGLTDKGMQKYLGNISY
uniref:Uncharacterized protein n=1 Tax=Rhizophagus irregularis (strain DAOM 181602 / DAOM 197198 / MUCL 43194) TaxID=747089 RepID=U9T592_RHIID